MVCVRGLKSLSNEKITVIKTHEGTAPGWRLGVRDAFGIPAAILAAGFIGYGSLAEEYGLSIAHSVFASVAIWALPGQLILIEMHGIGAAAIAIVLASTLSGARFLPMSMSLLPLIRDPRYGNATVYFAAQLISMIGWTMAMRRCPDLRSQERIPYLIGFQLTCIGVAAASAVAGHLLSGALPPLVRLGLVFLAPVYFLMILISELRTRLAALAVTCGAVAGPILYVVNPQWSVVAAGIIGGTVAYLVQRNYGQRG
jgi:predicted branched-subunit amino acid permease